MPTWLGQSARFGIVTTRYPDEPATPDEAPETSRSPRLIDPRHLSDAIAACPVGAIAESSIDVGACIRCGRCAAHGFAPRGPEDPSVRSRDRLREPWTGAVEPHPADAPAPLAGWSRSLHVFLVDVGSCNACNLEVLAVANPLYDASRLGIFFTNSPRHADALLVVGVPTEAMVEPVRRAYEALPDPKAVVAIGVCPISGGAFAGTPGLRPSLGDVIPVDVYVPGCPPTPLHVLDGLLRATGRARPRSEG